jgi:hypothetical protein
VYSRAASICHCVSAALADTDVCCEWIGATEENHQVCTTSYHGLSILQSHLTDLENYIVYYSIVD